MAERLTAEQVNLLQRAGMPVAFVHGSVLSIWASHDALVAQVESLTQERDEARSTNTRLNRALTQVAPAVEDNLAACMKAGMSFGRRLSGAGYMLEREKRIALEADLAAALAREQALREALTERRDSIVLAAETMRQLCAEAIERAIAATTNGRLMPLMPTECVTIVRSFTLPDVPALQPPDAPTEGQ